MRQAQYELRDRLGHNGWRVALETNDEVPGVGVHDTSWRLASTRPPVGRQVLVEFRVHEVEVYPSYWGDERRILRYAITVRYPVREGSPELLLECDCYRRDVNTFFRALEWFRDPTGHNLYHRPAPGDWLPPDDWDAERWRVGLEETWDTTGNLDEMLHAALSAGERKLRLVTCAVCRQLPVGMLDPMNRLAVEMAERYAEGESTKRELKKVCKQSGLPWLGQLDPRPALYRAVGQRQAEDASTAKAAVAGALREVLGNPARPPAFRHAWLYANGGVARRLVEAALAEQDYGVLPVLADALEDAGCAEAALLDHCRQARPHARGCWVVDLLTGKG